MGLSPLPRRVKGRLSNATPPVTPAKTRPRALSQPGTAPRIPADIAYEVPSSGHGEDDVSPALLDALPLSPPYTPGRRILGPALSGRNLGLNDLLRSILPSRIFKIKQSKQLHGSETRSALANVLLTPDPSPPRQTKECRDCECSPIYPRVTRLAAGSTSQDNECVDPKSVSTTPSQREALSSPLSLPSSQRTRSPTCDTVVDVKVTDFVSFPLDMAAPSDSVTTPTLFALRPGVRRYGSTYSDHFAAQHVLCSEFLQKYTLDGEIGSGGHGFVLTGHAQRSSEEVAVKFVVKSKLAPEQWHTDPTTNAQIPLEAHLLRTLDHPSIIACIDLFEDEKYFYLVLELHGSPWSKHMSPVLTQGQGSPLHFDHYRSMSEELDCEWHRLNPGVDVLQPDNDTPRLSVPRPALCTRRPSQDLFECIEHNDLSEDQARYVFSQVVGAVSYMHGHGVVHRDIKDENILIDSNLKVKLIDFGSAVRESLLEPEPLYTMFYGTPNYAASEIMKHQAYRSRPAEIWTLGILLCNIVWGCSPFMSDDGCKRGEVQLPRFVPNRRWLSSHTIPDCIDLLRGCLHVDPIERLDIQGVVSHPWLRT